MDLYLQADKLAEFVFHVWSKDFAVFLLSDKVKLLSPFGWN